MKKLLLTLSLALLAMPAFSQFDYEVSKDKENGQTVYKGPITFGDLFKETEFSWLQKGIDDYKPDTASIGLLHARLPRYTLIVFMGTWCDDSQNLIPKLYRVLRSAGYPIDRVQLFGVDRAKTTTGVEHRLYRITKVPTIILTSQSVEVGRITETVKVSIEQDLVNLLHSIEHEE